MTYSPISSIYFLLSSIFLNSVATVKLFTTAGIPTSTVVDCAVGAVMAQVALLIFKALFRCYLRCY